MARVSIDALESNVIPEGETREPIFINEHSSERKDVSWVVGSDTDSIDPNSIGSIVQTQEAPEDKEKPESRPRESHSESGEDGDEDLDARKKKKNTAGKRINELTRKLKEAQSFAYDIMNQKEYLEKELSKKEKQALAYHEKLLETNKNVIKEAMIKAKEEGDTATEVHAADLMAQYNNEMMRIKRDKESGYYNQRRTDNYIPQEIFDTQDYEEENTIEPEQREAGERWVKKNAWANPDSRSFNPSLAEEADRYSLHLAAKYQLQGRDDEIGRDEFWEDISDYMMERYDAPKTKHDSPPPRSNLNMRQPRSAPVAPPSRVTSRDTHSPRSRGGDIVLSPEQKEFARGMRGYIRDSKGNKIMDNANLEHAYKQRLMAENR
jgi:hypothetical protein